LPEVGRGLGKGIVEFKRGLKGISEEVEEQASRPPAPAAPRAELSTSSTVVPQATVLSQPPIDEVRVSRNDKFE
ncbi:MAG: twin-arginine translocase TatA/TatE family subunit, partial [Pyrinomonadaceae bacterium]|nr:twin-arginine translocase TatA/TatE family subunit [Phycisphaerales bacterium]